MASGGRGGIRTHGTLAGTPVFKTGALNHSATLPAQELQSVSVALIRTQCERGPDSNISSHFGEARRTPIAIFVSSTGEGMGRIVLAKRRGQRQQPGLAERRRQKARAQQHEAGRGQGKESVGDNVVAAHVTPTTEMLVRID